MKPSRKISETGSQTITKNKSDRTFKYTRQSTNRAIENYINHKLNDERGTSHTPLKTSSSNKLTAVLPEHSLKHRLSEEKGRNFGTAREQILVTRAFTSKECHKELHAKGYFPSKTENGNSQAFCLSESNKIFPSEEDSLQIQPTPTKVIRPSVEQLDITSRRNSKLEEIKSALIELVNETNDKSIIVNEVENIYKTILRLVLKMPNQLNEDQLMNSSMKMPKSNLSSRDNGDIILNALKNENNCLKTEVSQLKTKLEDLTKKYNRLCKENLQLKAIPNRTAEGSDSNNRKNYLTLELQKTSHEKNYLSSKERNALCSNISPEASQACPIPIPYISEKMRAYFPQQETPPNEDKILSLTASLFSVPLEEAKHMICNQGMSEIPEKKFHLHSSNSESNILH